MAMLPMIKNTSNACVPSKDGTQWSGWERYSQDGVYHVEEISETDTQVYEAEIVEEDTKDSDAERNRSLNIDNMRLAGDDSKTTIAERNRRSLEFDLAKPVGDVYNYGNIFQHFPSRI